MSESLRDQLEASFTKLEAETPPVEEQTPAPATDGTEPQNPAVSDTTPAPAASETAEQKAGRTAGRARDEQGRLLPGPAKKPDAPDPALQAAPLVPEVKRPNRPSSWKKDYWEHWDKLDPKLAEYINQREGEYAKGVSTYKSEWEQVKPLKDAIEPYRQVFEQYRVDPAAHVSELLKAHHTLVTGSPQEKLALVARIIQQNQVPLEHLLAQGQDGRFYLNQQLIQQAQARQPAPPVDVAQQVRQVLLNERTQQAIADFEREAPQKHPHYETVKGTMAGLLQAGLAEDLPSAYQAALRHPLHADIFEAQQQQQRQEEEAKKREAEAAKVRAAKANAVSTKTSTPGGGGKGEGKKGLRSHYEEQLADAEGRV